MASVRLTAAFVGLAWSFRTRPSDPEARSLPHPLRLRKRRTWRAASCQLIARYRSIKRLPPPAHDWNDALRASRWTPLEQRRQVPTLPSWACRFHHYMLRAVRLLKDRHTWSHLPQRRHIDRSSRSNSLFVSDLRVTIPTLARYVLPSGTSVDD